MLKLFYEATGIPHRPVDTENNVISAAGRQMANLYFGLILHQPPDIGFFRRQAQACAFDEAAY